MTRLLPAAGLVLLLFVAKPAQAQSPDFMQTSLQLTDASMFSPDVLSATFSVDDPFKSDLSGQPLMDMPTDPMHTDPDAGAVLPLSDDLTFDPTKPTTGAAPQN